MQLENSVVSLTFAPSGTLVRLFHKRTGHIVTDCVRSRSVTLLIDSATSDIWEARPDAQSAMRVDLSLFPAEMSLTQDADGQTLLIRHCVQPDGLQGYVEVKQTIRLPHESGMAQWKLDITNRLEKGVVVSAEILTDGLIDHDYALFWPLQDGNLFQRALRSENEGSQLRSDVRFHFNAQLSENNVMTEQRLVSTYPIPCSVQFLALANHEECFYFGYHDKKCSYKQFIFDKSGHAGMLVWPFISGGESFSVAPVYMGMLAGDWHEGADFYYDWLVHDSGRMRQMSPMAQQFKGMACFQAGSYPDYYHLKYIGNAPEKTVLAPADVRSRCINTDCIGTSITTFEQAAQYALDNSGLDMSLFMGWHRGGFDVYYPDYEILDSLGGREGLQECFDNMHRSGLKALLYTNIHLADTTGKWYNTPSDDGGKLGEKAAVLKGDGTFFHERYPHTTPNLYTAMCPKSKLWQDKLLEVIEGVRALGADGAFFDQVMTNPAFLCYNREHGHKTPATAFEEGYQEMLTRINEAYRKYGDDYLFCCEGIGDCYMNQIDVMGMLWFRKWGNAKAPYMKPEVLKYCIPAPCLGMQTYGEMGDNLYAYGFCMFAPPMTYPYIFDLTRRWVSLSSCYPSIYQKGRYLEHLGLESLPETVLSGVCMADDGQSVMLHLFNSLHDEVTLCIEPDLKRWKLQKLPDDWALINAETGEVLPRHKNGFELTMKGKEKIALLAGSPDAFVLKTEK